LATKKEVYESLSPDLKTAFDDPKECFGLEYVKDDDTCKECADEKICAEMFSAEGSMEETPKEVPESETLKEEASTEASKTVEEATMAEEKKDEAAKTDAPDAGEDVKKEKPKGFGDRTAAKDQFGFVVETKGSFIAHCVQTGLHTKDELIKLANDKFGSDSRGRTNMVLYRLRTKGFDLQRVGRKYFLEGITPADLVNAEKKKVSDAEEATKKIAAEKAAAKKAEVDKKAEADKKDEAAPPAA